MALEPDAAIAANPLDDTARRIEAAPRRNRLHAEFQCRRIRPL
jgi:hypothetical protein